MAAFHRLRYGDEAITPRYDLDHAGHFVPEERPERVAALLKEFLG